MMTRVLRQLPKHLFELPVVSHLIDSYVARTSVCSLHSQFSNFQEIKNDKTESSTSKDEFTKLPVTENANFKKSDENNSDKEYEENIKRKILDASLTFVSVHGWTKAAIVAGAQAVGYPGVVSEMFPLGGSDLVLYFNTTCNEQLKEYMKIKLESEQQKQKEEEEIDKETRIKNFIKDSIETRLRMVIPYIDKWPQALATLTLSRAVPNALTNILTLVDDICYYSGDRSVDFDWYVRRIALAGIYKATELYMLQDKSVDFHDTWKFLQRQLDDAVAIYACIRQSEQASQLTKEISTATFNTARNMLGINWKR